MVNPSRCRWLILTIILAVAVISIGIAFWTGVFFPRKVEKINFGSCECLGNSSSGDITEVNLYIENTGDDESVISKVWINETLLDSTEWESFPSKQFHSGDQGTLQITPSSIIFKEGTILQFTIETAGGNSFSHTAKLTFFKTEELRFIELTWSTDTAPYDNATLTVGNTGNGVSTIDAVLVNGESATYNATNPSTTLQPGDTAILVVEKTNDFASVTKYTFAIKTATGMQFQYVTTTP